MTAMYGLIGRTLGHSFSRGFFMSKFHAEHIDAVYENFEMEAIAEFSGLRERYADLRGCNVTFPYKEAIIPLLDGLSDLARAVGAVNCISFDGDRAIGHNTDVIGFRDSLAEVYDAAPGGRALILGTGGAAKAVHFVLTHYFEFDQIEFVSREPASAEQVSYDTVNTRGLADVRLIVNTTPLGMHPDLEGMPDVDLANLPASAMVFDLIYNPEETRLLAAARAQGCTVRNGLDMLIRQAEASWEIWNA